ncbi:RNase adapter RapZ [Saccharopolyspora sp. SCSIO 74807]|uniref:RapZ C-terminal domain-containing protein n=1 Tax=Saccharopolyspora sp. SCSIO 74807 TaxID=3118084 RepID=UPI0030D5DDE5
MNNPLLHVLTFGYARTPAPETNLTVDVRWIPNPWHCNEFRDLSGLDAPVQDWIFAQRGVAVWFEALLDVLGPTVAAAETRGEPLVTVAFGCQGGHDRSVAVALRLANAFQRAGSPAHVQHLSFVRGSR